MKTRHAALAPLFVAVATLTAIATTACLDALPGAVAGTSDGTASDGDVAVAPRPAGPDPFVEVRVGAIGVCMRTASGRATCAPQPGGLGAGPFVVAEAGATSLAAAGTVIWHEELMACVTTADDVRCSNGVRGYVLPIAGARALSVGDFIACALEGGGAEARILCWDPIGATAPEEPPALVSGPPVADVVALAASAYGVCALDEAGQVSCWDAHERSPQPVALDEPARAITAGIGHTCAVLASGAATCWGASPDDVPSPPEVPLDALDAGGWSTCGIERATGIVRCHSPGATRAWSLGALVQLDVGVAGVCGVTSGGEVACGEPWL